MKLKSRNKGADIHVTVPAVKVDKLTRDHQAESSKTNQTRVQIARDIREALQPYPKLLLTATPLQNSLLELYGLVSIIDEHVFGDINSFKSQFARLGDQLLKTGKLAKAADETIPTIRYWTSEGFLKVAKYTEGGYQLYDSSQIDRAKEVRYLQDEQRLTLGEIKEKLGIKKTGKKIGQNSPNYRVK